MKWKWIQKRIKFSPAFFIHQTIVPSSCIIFLINSNQYFLLIIYNFVTQKMRLKENTVLERPSTNTHSYTWMITFLLAYKFFYVYDTWHVPHRMDKNKFISKHKFNRSLYIFVRVYLKSDEAKTSTHQQPWWQSTFSCNDIYV